MNIRLLPGNRQKKAKAMIEASGLKMIAVEDFDLAARTVIVAVSCACFVRIFAVYSTISHTCVIMSDIPV